MSLFEEALYALGLMLMIEGVLYALFPTMMRRLLLQMIATGSDQLRNVGLFTAGLGLLLIWFLRG